MDMSATDKTMSNREQTRDIVSIEISDSQMNISVIDMERLAVEPRRDVSISVVEKGRQGER